MDFLSPNPNLNLNPNPYPSIQATVSPRPSASNATRCQSLTSPRIEPANSSPVTHTTALPGNVFNSNPSRGPFPR